jgi:hypothetical protein
MHLLLAATDAQEGQGVNLLPILLVAIIIVIGVFIWRRRADR